MKRTKHIDLEMMRKKVSPRLLLRPMVVAVTAALLASCSSQEDVKVVASIDDCTTKTELTQEQCEVAYKKALAEAERTGPKYPSRRACESEFGNGQCIQQSSGGVFMPMMAGFMVGQMLSGRNDYYGRYNPVYHYRRSYSSHNNQLMTADGSVIGRAGKNSYKVPKSSLKPKPSVTRTVSRGGFGSVASAKSKWGGGRSRGGWGG